MLIVADAAAHDLIECVLQVIDHRRLPVGTLQARGASGQLLSGNETGDGMAISIPSGVSIFSAR
ncbi:hypothetical protein [Paraburkholderia sp.]|uniref:hypothetical protein n=1 Tax=Paraburkholderia sp. TaxID=1926495 RepID=UPI0039E6241B